MTKYSFNFNHNSFKLKNIQYIKFLRDYIKKLLQKHRYDVLLTKQTNQFKDLT